MRILLLLLLSFFTWSDDHENMYEGIFADYVFCNADEDMSDDKRFAAFQKFIMAWNKHANSFENNVSLSVVTPIYTDAEMRGGSDFFFVKHAPSRKALGAFNQKITELITGDDKMPEPPFECEDANETFQRVGPSSDGEEYSEGIVEYWPCNYTEGADPMAMREAEAKLALEHCANGAEGGFRYIYPGSGSPREGSPDFYISRGSPSFEARGASHDIYWAETQGSEADLERRKHMSCANSSLWSWWRLKES